MHHHDSPFSSAPHIAFPCEWTDLGDGHTIGMCRLPEDLLPSNEQFKILWELHPAEHRTVVIVGRPVPIPRWQEAYERDYKFSGQTAIAQPASSELLPYLHWAQSALDPRLNGLLLNWYDAVNKHYIGAHYDKHEQLVPNTPIITISLGEPRAFRLTREEKRNGKKVVAETRDFIVEQGSVVILPWATNLAWKHSVPHLAHDRGRRISITVRAFQQDFKVTV